MSVQVPSPFFFFATIMKNINNDNNVNNNNQANLSGAFFNDRVFQISPVQDIWPFCIFQAVVCEQSRQGPI